MSNDSILENSQNTIDNMIRFNYYISRKVKGKVKVHPVTFHLKIYKGR